MNTATSALNLIERTQEVVDYQSDPELSGRPIAMMLAGALLAIVSAVLCGMLAYEIWYEQDVASSSGLFGASLLFCFYVGGAYVFALAYELYDVPRALRFTLVLAVLGVLALAFMIGALIALAYIKTGAGLAVSEQQGGKVIGALTYLGGEEDDGGPTKAEPNPYFSMITCKHCDRQFFPVPPAAICPWCDTAYLTA